MGQYSTSFGSNTGGGGSNTTSSSTNRSFGRVLDIILDESHPNTAIREELNLLTVSFLNTKEMPLQKIQQVTKTSHIKGQVKLRQYR